jgi:hypothetical protein
MAEFAEHRVQHPVLVEPVGPAERLRAPAHRRNRARAGRLVPIEVKWTERPTRNDARHLLTFLDEHPGRATRGYVVCRCPVPLEIDDRVTALPWSSL